MTRRYKYLANKTRASILVSYAIGRETWLHDLFWGGGGYVYYLSYIHFELIYAGDRTDCIIGMLFVTWCIIKLYCYVTLCRDCLIIIVANDISNPGRKIISWIWGFCDVTMKSDFSDLILKNCLFLTRKIKPPLKSKLV